MFLCRLYTLGIGMALLIMEVCLNKQSSMPCI